LALTPDTPNEAFLREVDENLRRDQLHGFAKKYGKWLIGALILFLVAVAGWLFWQDRQDKRSAAQSEELAAIYADIGAGKTDAAKQKLELLKSDGDGVVRALALLTEAAIALDSNDRDSALANYRAITGDSGMPESYRDLALIRATALEFDKLRPEEVISRLEPLTKPDSPWFGTAGEMTAMAYLKQGKKEQAGRLFAAIAANAQAPESLRNRAVQIAGSLGVDASAALQQPAQPGN